MQLASVHEAPRELRSALSTWRPRHHQSGFTLTDLWVGFGWLGAILGLAIWQGWIGHP